MPKVCSANMLAFHFLSFFFSVLDPHDKMHKETRKVIAKAEAIDPVAG